MLVSTARLSTFRTYWESVMPDAAASRSSAALNSSGTLQEMFFVPHPSGFVLMCKLHNRSEPRSQEKSS